MNNWGGRMEPFYDCKNNMNTQASLQTTVKNNYWGRRFYQYNEDDF